MSDARYFFVEARRRVVSMTAVCSDPDASDGWQIKITFKNRRGALAYAHMLEETNGNLRHARFTSEALAQQVIVDLGYA